MNATTCGGYIVVIDVPRVVVINVGLAGFAQIVIGLFKLPNFFQKWTKIPTNLQTDGGFTDRFTDEIPRFSILFEKNFHKKKPMHPTEPFRLTQGVPSKVRRSAFPTSVIPTDKFDRNTRRKMNFSTKKVTFSLGKSIGIKRIFSSSMRYFGDICLDRMAFILNVLIDILRNEKFAK